MRHVVAGVLAVMAGSVAGGSWPAAVEAASPVAAAASVTVPDGTHLIVRTYAQGAPAADLPAARRTAGAILGRAGIEVTWRDCGVPGEAGALPAAACDEPLRRNELLVRLVPAGTADGRSDAGTLGFAFVDLGAGGGSLATVYVDRVRAMAQAAGVEPAALLGRAIAHEVGHLLLGTNRHAAHGLMRASWSVADLRRNRTMEWLFDGKEGDAMRRGLAGRLRPSRLLASIAGSRDEQFDIPLR